MFIWAALLFPLLALGISLTLFRHRMALWEYALIFIVPVICIATSYKIGAWASVQEDEVWNTYPVKIAYYEEWDEWDDEICTRTVSCGDNCTTTETYDCSHRDYHPPQWEMWDNIGEETGITQAMYEVISSTWKTTKFIDMNRHYYRIDGNAYQASLPGTSVAAMIFPLTTMHTYENRIRRSRNVLDYPDIDDSTVARYGLYQFPEVELFGYEPFMGESSSEANDILAKANALNGSSKRLHMLILKFNTADISAASLQEALWVKGNKNEFITCVGVQNGSIAWVKSFSWTTSMGLMGEVDAAVMGLGAYDPVKVATVVSEMVPKKFVKRDFAEFKYIDVEPSETASWVGIFVTFALTLGMTIWAVSNQFDATGNRYRRW